jgi:hypothetical protein
MRLAAPHATGVLAVGDSDIGDASQVLTQLSASDRVCPSFRKPADRGSHAHMSVRKNRKKRATSDVKKLKLLDFLGEKKEKWSILPFPKTLNPKTLKP